MEEVLNGVLGHGVQNRRISEVMERERRRLFQFIRRRVGNEGDAEDILQDVFYELIETYRLMKPVEQVGAWLYRVARNRIIDRFRKRKRETPVDDGGEGRVLEDLLPGPDALYARGVLLDEIEAAMEELPAEQREIFVAHEIEGRSFKEISEETGVNINTLLSRKRYAVTDLRMRLKAIHDEFISR
jgi:RNA polymerase sigma factor (sigma-70 family)